MPRARTIGPCQKSGKIKYKTPEEAAKAAFKILLEEKTELTPTRCTDCHWWHLNFRSKIT